METQDQNVNLVCRVLEAGIKALQSQPHDPLPPESYAYLRKAAARWRDVQDQQELLPEALEDSQRLPSVKEEAIGDTPPSLSKGLQAA